jgi:hypothetical protein
MRVHITTLGQICGAMAVFCALGIGRDALLKSPEPYDLEQLYSVAKKNCPGSELPCFERQFGAITAKNGPAAAIGLFTLLQSRGDIGPTKDGHHIAHHIGHETAMDFGATAEALALCPDSYNYGCMHGFFQHALGMGALSSAAAARICDDLQGPAYPGKTWQSCYHGFGHGVMLSSDYDIPKALAVCDSLQSRTAQEACWQGVFMENVDVALEGDWKKGSFSHDDPLAPCDQLGSKYQFECYSNQSGWLMRFYHNDVGQAAQACLKAAPESVKPCMQTIGLITTSPSWQAHLLGQEKLSGPFLENAWRLCQKFPADQVDQCVLGATDNLMNTATVEQAKAYCNIVDQRYQSACMGRVNADLDYLIVKQRKPEAETPATAVPQQPPPL